MIPFHYLLLIPSTIENCAVNHPSDAIVLSSLILNCQSPLAKKESFVNLLDLHHPDIVFGSESWSKPNIVYSEVFPSDYTVYRKDHPDGYGGLVVISSVP